DRHHQFAVRFQEIVGTSLRTGINLFIRRAEIGEKADAFALALDVVVAPLPLVAGRLDGDIWRGRILDGEYRLGRRPGHADQDKERHERPDDFDRGVLVELFRLRAYRLAVLDDRINHHREYAEEHHQTDGQHQVVQVIDFACHRRDRWLEVVPVRLNLLRADDSRKQRERKAGNRQKSRLDGHVVPVVCNRNRSKTLPGRHSALEPANLARNNRARLFLPGMSKCRPTSNSLPLSANAIRKPLRPACAHTRTCPAWKRWIDTRSPSPTSTINSPSRRTIRS